MRTFSALALLAVVGVPQAVAPPLPSPPASTNACPAPSPVTGPASATAGSTSTAATPAETHTYSTDDRHRATLPHRLA